VQVLVPQPATPELIEIKYKIGASAAAPIWARPRSRVALTSGAAEHLGAGAGNVALARFVAGDRREAALFHGVAARPGADGEQLGDFARAIVLGFEPAHADWRQRGDDGLIGRAAGRLLRRTARHPTAVTEADDRERDGAGNGAPDERFGLFGNFELEHFLILGPRYFTRALR